MAESVCEESYVTALEGADHVPPIREPNCYRHRPFEAVDTGTNLSVVFTKCPKIDRMFLFRDRLRSHELGSRLYDQS